MSQPASGNENCPICHEAVELYGYGSCNHVTCAKCSIKLRKFEYVRGKSEFSNCPTCRQKIERMVISKQLVPFDTLNTSAMILDHHLDLLFDSKESMSYYKDVISCRCPVCHEVHSNMSALNRHVSTKHDLVYCDLCLRNARLLPSEFEPIPRDQLAEHKKFNGIRGHPECEFCRERFYDFEALLQHMRTKHFVCDLCQRQRKHFFFKSQDDMWRHYESEHYVCTWCRAQDVTNVFSSQLELQAHRMNDHRDRLSRNDTHIPIPPPASSLSLAERNRSGRGYGGRHNQNQDNSAAAPPPDPTFAQPTEFVPVPTDFPTLSGAAPALPGVALTSATVATPASGVEDVRTAFSNAAALRVAPVVTNSADRALMGEVSGTYSVAANKVASSSRSLLTTEDFPSLGGSQAPSGGPGLAWGKSPMAAPVPFTTGPKKKTPLGNTHSTAPSMQDGDFPALPASRRSKPDALVTSLQTLSLKKKDKPQKAKAQKQQQQSTNQNKSTSQSATKLTSVTADADDYPELPSYKDDGRLYVGPPVAESRVAVVSPSLFAAALESTVSTVQATKTTRPVTAPNLTSEHDFPDLNTNTNIKESHHQSGDHSNAKKNNKKKGNKASGNPTSAANSSQSSSAPSAAPDGYISMEDFTSTFAGVKYLPQEDFNSRNQTLYSLIQQAIGQEYFDKLVELAKTYRSRQMKPQKFVSDFKSLVGADRALSWLPELIALLDDIGLQRSLFKVLSKKERGDLYECFHCGQVGHDWEKTAHFAKAHPS